ncbi:MAG: LytTR family DNA-binding domain-containing protein [Methylotenera sp.]|uniref:LytR/AlgR family response regulator transcription factor n=1 Tax=Methylotenera sp. TaxID=2051956 RepID=UPI00248876C6|nr:LytTR family DNA-binding domain-containing protein [Methylotenera sp.]MDI1309025.1 LytTR family DNA-binding domain-containing protein [Methylotenera sp.]
MTDSLNILIVDDEAPARNRLRELLSEMNHIHIVAEAKNGQEALNLANTHQPDIVLLDIRMPNMDGIEAAQHLQKITKPPAIIFTTAFDNYAMQAFDMSAVDYLLKPIRLERLQTAIQKARALLPSQLQAIAPPSPQKTHFCISERGRILLIPVVDVIYLRAELKYITVRTAEKEYLLEESLNNLEQEFHNTFIRLHRNCLVAKAYILGYEKRHQEFDEDGNKSSEKHWVALLKNTDETIAVSRRQQHLIRAN